jgi:hypothetical protein
MSSHDHETNADVPAGPGNGYLAIHTITYYVLQFKAHCTHVQHMSRCLNIEATMIVGGVGR